MWTLVLKVLSSPKNLIIVLLVTALCSLGLVYSYKSMRLDKVQSEADMLTKVVKAYQDNSEAVTKALANQQKIENNLAGIKHKIEQMKPSKCLESYDEKVFTDITWMFNNPGLSPEQCTPSKKGVPETSKTCVGDTNWTGQQIARNYEELVKSYMQLEETVKCYEQ